LLDESEDGSGSSDTFEDFIQTDASINEGNSGGPLVDAQGRLVGMDSAIMSTSRSGGSIGIGFAIPSSLLRQVVRDLTVYGSVRRGFLGVEIQDLDHDLVQAMGLTSTHGALVNTVNPNEPAGVAGVERGDVVVKVNDQDVDTADKMRYLVASNEPGAMVALTVLRGGDAQVIKVKLGDRDALTGASQPLEMPTSRFSAPNAPGANAPAAGPLAGLTLEALTPGLRGQYHLPGNLSGLVVSNVDENSPYADQFAVGMVVVEVNRRAVTSVEQAEGLLKPGAVNVLYVYTGGNDGHFGYEPVLLPGQK
jgi:S1-C subfamily serine protease